MPSRSHRPVGTGAGSRLALPAAGGRRSAPGQDAILAFQRSAGNHAVAQALRAKPASPVVARLHRYDVKLILDELGAANREDVSQEVIETIAEVTTSWEREAPRRTRDRDERVAAALPELLRTLKDEHAGKLPNPQDAALWRRLIRKLIARLEDAEGKAGTEETPAAAELPESDSPERLPAGGGRRVIRCTMGQGVVANLSQYTLFSDRFSSCSPVVMFNEQTRLGGLFHYGAKKSGQQAELREMFRRVEPTYIGVNRRLNPMKPEAEKYVDDDYESLMRFFEHRLRVDENTIHRITREGDSYAVFVDEQQKLRIEGSVPARLAGPGFNATRMDSSRRLNGEVALLVNKDVYAPYFAH